MDGILFDKFQFLATLKMFNINIYALLCTNVKTLGKGLVILRRDSHRPITANFRNTVKLSMTTRSQHVTPW